MDFGEEGDSDDAAASIVQEEFKETQVDDIFQSTVTHYMKIVNKLHVVL